MKIHACVNDCVLFRGEYQDLHECPTREQRRWKNADPEGHAEGGATHDGGVKKKLIPQKIL